MSFPAAVLAKCRLLLCVDNAPSIPLQLHQPTPPFNLLWLLHTGACTLSRPVLCVSRPSIARIAKRGGVSDLSASATPADALPAFCMCCCHTPSVADPQTHITTPAPPPPQHSLWAFGRATRQLRHSNRLTPPHPTPQLPTRRTCPQWSSMWRSKSQRQQKRVGVVHLRGQQHFDASHLSSCDMLFTLRECQPRPT